MSYSCFYKIIACSRQPGFGAFPSAFRTFSGLVLFENRVNLLRKMIKTYFLLKTWLKRECPWNKDVFHSQMVNRIVMGVMGAMVFMLPFSQTLSRVLERVLVGLCIANSIYTILLNGGWDICDTYIPFKLSNPLSNDDQTAVQERHFAMIPSLVLPYLGGCNPNDEKPVIQTLLTLRLINKQMCQLVDRTIAELILTPQITQNGLSPTLQRRLLVFVQKRALRYFWQPSQWMGFFRNALFHRDISSEAILHLLNEKVDHSTQLSRDVAPVFKKWGDRLSAITHEIDDLLLLWASSYLDNPFMRYFFLIKTFLSHQFNASNEQSCIDMGVVNFSGKLLLAMLIFNKGFIDRDLARSCFVMPVMFLSASFFIERGRFFTFPFAKQVVKFIYPRRVLSAS